MRVADLVTALVLMAVGGLVMFDAVRLGFDWGSASPGTGVPADAFSVRWTGQITPTSTSTTWQLGVWTDGGVRLYVNNQLVINDWAIPSGGGASTVIAVQTVNLYKGPW